MDLSVNDYKDIEALISKVSAPLEHIAGSLAEIMNNVEAIVANGATLTVSVKIGEQENE